MINKYIIIVEMEDFTTFFLILICITIFYAYLENKASDVTYVKVGKIEYLVRNLPNKEDAAKLLSQIRQRLKKLVEYLDTNIKSYKDQEGIKRMKINYRPNNISESSPGNAYTSYSINKGEKVVYCLRSKDGNNKLTDLNTMMFVAIHELAHIMTKSVGHTTEFWDNMKFLLKVGVEIGIYIKQDFNKNPVEYCGTKITDTPLNS